jgi:23S rRNA (adenine2030-N6)-methyltransferase
LKRAFTESTALDRSTQESCGALNYRHAFHAGNFGDVLKHAALALALAHLRAKPAPFRVIDTHAGRGVYDLAGPEAVKTGEWREGVGALFDDRPGGAVGAALAPFFALLDAMNPSGRLRSYPGSPEIALRSTRPGDAVVLHERHPEDGPRLARRYAGDARVKVVLGDGWEALSRGLPPSERRGLVLVDPPFEEGPDYVRLSTGLLSAHRRFATGVYMLWYPVKGSADVKGLLRALREAGIPRMLRAELHRRAPNHPNRLDGAGLIVVNPTWKLDEHLAALLPALAARFATGPGAGHVLEWLSEADGA